MIQLQQGQLQLTNPRNIYGNAEYRSYIYLTHLVYWDSEITARNSFAVLLLIRALLESKSSQQCNNLTSQEHSQGENTPPPPHWGLKIVRHIHYLKAHL